MKKSIEGGQTDILETTGLTLLSHLSYSVQDSFNKNNWKLTSCEVPTQEHLVSPDRDIMCLLLMVRAKIFYFLYPAGWTMDKLWNMQATYKTIITSLNLGPTSTTFRGDVKWFEHECFENWRARNRNKRLVFLLVCYRVTGTVLRDYVEAFSYQLSIVH